MQIGIETDRTLNGIKTAIVSAMNHIENKRKQTFVCVAECGGNRIIVHPQSEYGNYSANYHGYQGVQRHNWRNNPNYPDMVAKHLLGLMIGEHIK